MESITQNKLRIGNFTSSNIYKLMGTPAMRATYIEEKRIERKLGRSVELEAYSQAMAWGSFLEQRVHNLLGIEYILCSGETKSHPTIGELVGTQDFIVPGIKISELKCYEPKNFSKYTDAILAKDTERIKKTHPKEYWQAVNNSIICGVPKAELITYMPYRSELAEIRDMALNYEGKDATKYEFIFKKEDAYLAWLPDKGSIYKNLNIFTFDVPTEDRTALTMAVVEAVKLLKAA